MVTTFDVLNIFEGAKVVAVDGEAAVCRHCSRSSEKSRKPVPRWRANGKIIERIKADGTPEFACHYCGRAVKLGKKKPDAKKKIITKPTPMKNAPEIAVTLPHGFDQVISGFLIPLFNNCPGNIEIRCLPSRLQLFSRDFTEITAFVADHIDQNIFFGVGTRKDHDGSKAGVSHLPALWADLDYKTYPKGETEAMEIVENFKPAPAILVKSGHGLHLYWIFDRPLPADLAVEKYLKVIAKRLNADAATTDVSRVMRLPGTFNYKFGEKILVKFRNDTGERIGWTEQ